MVPSAWLEIRRQEYKGRRELDGERHASSRDESRA